MSEQHVCPGCQDLRDRFEHMQERELRELRNYKVAFFVMLVLSSVQLGMNLVRLIPKHW